MTISVSKDDACREAGEAYNAMSQALVKVAKPGADPVYSTAELAPMRAQITKTTERLSRLAFRSSDERLRAAIQQLADAGAAYLPVTRLGTAHQEGAALSQAARNLGDLCN
ncbi:hypothetical protein [Pseudosporangium ferrugineum]|uniref:hypothetical protein n=1 Tax=Pseudosporangium ferrugineum TaxID=439699 RepID=UPI0011B2278F|nr:hypothetical protein [Pseudosporangium ferrugineum]